MAEDWAETDPEELERQRKEMERINAANPGGEDHSKSFVEGGETGGWLKGVGETLEAGRSTTASDRDQYIADARAAGASDEYMQDFLSRNPGDYSRLKRVWLDETTDQPDSNRDDVRPEDNYNPVDQWNNNNNNNTSNTTPTTPTVQPPVVQPPVVQPPVAPPPPPTPPPVVPVEPPPPDPNIERIRIQLEEAQARDKARADALWGQLDARSKQTLAIDRNDPIIRAQADAYNANEQRSSNDYLADLAEQSGPYTNMLGEQRLTSERVGQRTGAFESELMGRELSARRDEIAGALAGMGGMLTADQQRSLTQELALMDNAIKEKQLAITKTGQNNDYSLGWGRLGLDTELGRGGLTLDRDKLNQNESQFGRSLGQNESQFGRSLDQEMKIRLMQNQEFLQRLGFDTSSFASNDDYRRSYIQ